MRMQHAIPMSWRSPRTAWILWSFTFGIWLLIIGMIALPRSAAGDGLFAFPRFGGSLLMLSAATVGALVAGRRPENLIGWIFCTAALGWAVDALAAEYALYALVGQPGLLPAGTVAAWLSAWLFVPSGAAIIFLLLVFPDGRQPQGRWRSVVWAVLIGAGLWMFGIAFAPGPLATTIYVAPDNPFGLQQMAWVRTAGPIGMYLTVAAACLAAASLVARLRRTHGVARQQFKWFGFGAVGVVVVAGSAWISIVALDVRLTEPLGELLTFAALLALAGVPITTGIAILRYRLYEIDVIINRTLVYGTVTALLASLFAALSVITQRVVLALTGQESEAAVVLAALVVTALYQPLRAHVQILVDRRFYRRKYDASQTLERFALQLREEVELDRLATGLVGVVRDTMQPAHAFLWLRPTAGAEAVRGSPRQPGAREG
jgi:hypothetical protein